MLLSSPVFSSAKMPKLVTLSLVLLALAGSACKSSDTPLPPSPASLINGTRDRLNPFRMTFATDPASPNVSNQITLKVHILDAESQPADGVSVDADLSMMGGGATQHLALGGAGGGDYEAAVTVDQPGSWDVDLTASKDGKSSKQRVSFDVQ
jgi:hypothetical protein